VGVATGSVVTPMVPTNVKVIDASNFSFGGFLQPELPGGVPGHRDHAGQLFRDLCS
jgi:hypothetical protein